MSNSVIRSISLAGLALLALGCSDDDPAPACPTSPDTAGGALLSVGSFADVGGKSEGLVFDGAGDLYVTLTRKGEVVKVTAAGGVSKVASGLAAPSGIALAGDGSLYVCEYGTTSGGGKLTQLSTAGKVLTTTSSAGGKTFVNPNHVVVSSLGVVYMSDSSGFVARLESGKAELLFDAKQVNTVASPNGMALSSDEGTLYVNDLLAGTGMWRISLDSQGRKTKVAAMTLSTSLTMADGIALDCRGMLYVTYLGSRVARVNPADGKVETIYSGLDFSTPANIAFGHGPGFERRALYVTQLGLAGAPTKIKTLYVGFPGL